MTAASITWDFASNITTPSSATGGLSGSWDGMDATPVGWDASGAFYWQNQSTTVGRLIVGPPVGTQWTPGQITFKIRRSISGTVNVYFSSGGDYTVEQTLSVTNAYSTHTIDLSGMGTVDGPIDLRWWGPGTSTTRYYLDDVTVSGEVVAGSDQSLSPAGFAGVGGFGGFGSPSLVSITLATPEGIASDEAFGLPSLSEYIPPTLVLLPGGLDSDEGFGAPDLVHYVPPPVTGLEVATFMGQEDNDYILGIAEEAVRIITSLARTYTRGRGFEPLADDLRDVIIVASARLVGNPGQTQQWVGSNFIQSGFQGWSLAEQLIMNQYRKRVAA